MSTMCDGCKQLLDQDDGHARVSIFDPAPDFSSNKIWTAVPEGISLPRRAPQIDLCATCLLKLIAALDLPPDTFVPRPPRAEPVADVPAGALTPEDLVALGLKVDP